MSSNSRNTRMIAALVVAMTLAAGLLLQLESRMPRPAWDDASPLMARQDRSVETLVISTMADTQPLRGSNPDLGDYDAAIRADGECYWREPGSSTVRLVLLAGSGPMSPAQAQSLLLVIRSLHNLRGLDLARVSLEAPPADHAAAALSRDVRALLARKGIVR